MKSKLTVLTAAALTAFGAMAINFGAHKAIAEDARPKQISVDYFGAGGMQVTFADDITAEVRSEFLKSELENYVRIFKPERDYFATAYDIPGKNLGGAMIYVHDRNKVMSLDLYQQGR